MFFNDSASIKLIDDGAILLAIEICKLKSFVETDKELELFLRVEIFFIPHENLSF